MFVHRFFDGFIGILSIVFCTHRPLTSSFLGGGGVLFFLRLAWLCGGFGEVFVFSSSGLARWGLGEFLFLFVWFFARRLAWLGFVLRLAWLSGAWGIFFCSLRLAWLGCFLCLAWLGGAWGGQKVFFSLCLAWLGFILRLAWLSEAWGSCFFSSSGFFLVVWLGSVFFFVWLGSVGLGGVWFYFSSSGLARWGLGRAVVSGLSRCFSSSGLSRWGLGRAELFFCFFSSSGLAWLLFCLAEALFCLRLAWLGLFASFGLARSGTSGPSRLFLFSGLARLLSSFGLGRAAERVPSFLVAFSRCMSKSAAQGGRGKASAAGCLLRTCFFSSSPDAAAEQYQLREPLLTEDGRVIRGSWWSAYCRLQPGSACGTQPVESKHATGWRTALVAPVEEQKRGKKAIERNHMPPSDFFPTFAQALETVGKQCRKIPSQGLVDMPTRRTRCCEMAATSCKWVAPRPPTYGRSAHTCALRTARLGGSPRRAKWWKV